MWLGAVNTAICVVAALNEFVVWDDRNGVLGFFVAVGGQKYGVPVLKVNIPLGEFGVVSRRSVVDERHSSSAYGSHRRRDFGQLCASRMILWSCIRRYLWLPASGSSGVPDRTG